MTLVRSSFGILYFPLNVIAELHYFHSRFNVVADSDPTAFDLYFPNVDSTDIGCLRDMSPAARYRGGQVDRNRAATIAVQRRADRQIRGAHFLQQ